jgi:2-C-methyl-D-erythritol 4-phosphate cytidylyltransferase
VAVALIVAAGRGQRLGFSHPKALVTLAGKPMLDWSVAALRAVSAVQRIVIALPAGQLQAAPAGTSAVVGGAARSHSVRAALQASGDGDPVVVHDAARPLASSGLFERAIAELEASDADAVVAAIPVSDTIKETHDRAMTVARTLDRSRLWAVQTPQVFRRAALTAVFAQASDDTLAAATDDAWLIERAGGSVRLVLGEPGNIKITTSLDLAVAERVLAERRR